MGPAIQPDKENRYAYDVGVVGSLWDICETGIWNFLVIMYILLKTV